MNCSRSLGISTGLALLAFALAGQTFAAPAPAPAKGPARAVAQGDYECWAFNRARAGLNFTVTGPGRYRASDDSTGTFTFTAASGRVAFTGYLGEVMPDGFTTIYHEPNGRPTVSFRGRTGSEASFCVKV